MILSCNIDGGEANKALLEQFSKRLLRQPLMGETSVRIEEIDGKLNFTIGCLPMMGIPVITADFIVLRVIGLSLISWIFLGYSLFMWTSAISLLFYYLISADFLYFMFKRGMKKKGYKGKYERVPIETVLRRVQHGTS